jgi:hypothetical protein
MLRNLFAAAIGIALLPAAVLAVGFQPIVGLPGSFIPGQGVSFDVRLPSITNLGSYNIDLVLESNVGTAGVDFFFDAAATGPASMSYVFPSTLNYVDAVTVDSATRHRITLTDFDLSGVNVVGGTNDRVATVVFGTSAAFKGPLSIFVDAPLLILDTPDVPPTSVAGFSMIQSEIAIAAGLDLIAVPEPSTLLLGAVCLVFSLLNRGAAKRDYC